MALEVFGWNHDQYCNNEKFHVPYLLLRVRNGGFDFAHDNGKIKVYCKCKICGDDSMGYNHNLRCYGEIRH